MKTEVYSWRVSPDLKADLEREARLRNSSLSALLDTVTREWLAARHKNDGDAAEQRRLHAAAAAYIGSIKGDGTPRSENVSKLVKERLRQRYGR
jgi:hypothetical protein